MTSEEIVTLTTIIKLELDGYGDVCEWSTKQDEIKVPPGYYYYRKLLVNAINQRFPPLRSYGVEKGKIMFPPDDDFIKSSDCNNRSWTNGP